MGSFSSDLNSAILDVSRMLCTYSGALHGVYDLTAGYVANRRTSPIVSLRIKGPIHANSTIANDLRSRSVVGITSSNVEGAVCDVEDMSINNGVHTNNVGGKSRSDVKTSIMHVGVILRRRRHLELPVPLAQCQSNKL